MVDTPPSLHEDINHHPTTSATPLYPRVSRHPSAIHPSPSTNISRPRPNTQRKIPHCMGDLPLDDKRLHSVLTSSIQYPSCLDSHTHIHTYACFSVALYMLFLSHGVHFGCKPIFLRGLMGVFSFVTVGKSTHCLGLTLALVGFFAWGRWGKGGMLQCF